MWIWQKIEREFWANAEYHWDFHELFVDLLHKNVQVVQIQIFCTLRDSKIIQYQKYFQSIQKFFDVFPNHYYFRL